MTTVNFGPLVAGSVTVVAGQAWYCDGTRWIPSAVAAPSVDYIAKYVCVGGETVITFDNLPQTFADLEVSVHGRSSAAGNDLGVFCQFNGDSTSGNYTGAESFTGYNAGSSIGQGVSATSAGNRVGSLPGVTTATAFGQFTLRLVGYSGSTIHKGAVTVGFEFTNEAGAARRIQMVGSAWKSTAPISKLVFTMESSNAFAAGTTFTVYGRGRSLSVSGVSGLILREEKIASASAQLDFTNWYNSSFDEYVLELIGIVNGSSAIPQLRCSVDGGATFDSGSNYASIYGHSYSGGTAAGGSNSTTQVNLVDTAKLPTAGGSWNGSIRLFTPGSTSLWKNFIGQVACYNSSDGLVGSSIYGTYKSMSAINALRVLMSTGNITSGAVRIYAVAR